MVFRGLIRGGVSRAGCLHLTGFHFFLFLLLLELFSKCESVCVCPWAKCKNPKSWRRLISRVKSFYHVMALANVGDKRGHKCIYDPNIGQYTLESDNFTITLYIYFKCQLAV